MPKVIATRDEPHTASAVLMIRPAHFGANPETAASNFFQGSEIIDAAASRAQREFDALALRLAAAGVRVHQFAGQSGERLPDEVFTNNWLSLHADGTAVLYPLLAPNRRRERRPELLDALRTDGYLIERVVDLTPLERRGLFLEGTGSLVLDHGARVAYACLSPRTHADALAEFGRALGYEAVPFDAVDRAGRAVYHTNVLLAIGSRFAAVCSAAIAAPRREQVLERLAAGGREIVDLTFEQLHSFAGNMLEVRGRDGGAVIALSATAFGSLDAGQIERLRAQGELVTANINTIESVGGGSVRCMLAEVPLSRAPTSIGRSRLTRAGLEHGDSSLSERAPLPSRDQRRVTPDADISDRWGRRGAVGATTCAMALLRDTNRTAS